MSPAENFECFGVAFCSQNTITCRCPPDRCVASSEGLRIGRVSSISDIHCRACTPTMFSTPFTPILPKSFPLGCDDTHRTETFGPIDNDTDQGMQAMQKPKLESDPSGRDAHAPGAKLDSGKVRPGLVLGGFARALLAISHVGTYGAVKYTEDGWTTVPNGEARYEDAFFRHWLKDKLGETHDPDTELTHLAHCAWNAMAKLDLAIRKQEQIKK